MNWKLCIIESRTGRICAQGSPPLVSVQNIWHPFKASNLFRIHVCHGPNNLLTFILWTKCMQSLCQRKNRWSLVKFLVYSLFTPGSSRGHSDGLRACERLSAEFCHHWLLSQECFQHSRIFLASPPNLPKFPPINKSQRLLSHVVKNSYRKGSHSPDQFWVLDYWPRWHDRKARIYSSKSCPQRPTSSHRTLPPTSYSPIPPSNTISL